MARRFERSSGLFPIEMHAVTGTKRFEVAGRIVDLSKTGLRIETGPWLIPGQLLHVYSRSSAKPFACCRVVWTHTAGGALPSEAGLEIVERSPDVRTVRRRFRVRSRFGDPAQIPGET